MDWVRSASILDAAKKAGDASKGKQKKVEGKKKK